jgi:hypothetical protein
MAERGKAMTLRASSQTPSLRCRLSGEPAISSGMWRARGGEASAPPARVKGNLGLGLNNVSWGWLDVPITLP